MDYLSNLGFSSANLYCHPAPPANVDLEFLCSTTSECPEPYKQSLGAYFK